MISVRYHKRILFKIMFILESVLTRIQKTKESEENAKKAEESIKPD